MKLLLLQALVRKVLGSIRESGRKGLDSWFLPRKLMERERSSLGISSQDIFSVIACLFSPHGDAGGS